MEKRSQRSLVSYGFVKFAPSSFSLITAPLHMSFNPFLLLKKHIEASLRPRLYWWDSHKDISISLPTTPKAEELPHLSITVGTHWCLCFKWCHSSFKRAWSWPTDSEVTGNKEGQTCGTITAAWFSYNTELQAESLFPPPWAEGDEDEIREKPKSKMLWMFNVFSKIFSVFSQQRNCRIN